jgi:hypothetical protein
VEAAAAPRHARKWRTKSIASAWQRTAACLFAPPVGKYYAALHRHHMCAYLRAHEHLRACRRAVPQVAPAGGEAQAARAAAGPIRRDDLGHKLRKARTAAALAARLAGGVQRRRRTPAAAKHPAIRRGAGMGGEER